jgi:hypothetical protein
LLSRRARERGEDEEKKKRERKKKRRRKKEKRARAEKSSITSYHKQRISEIFSLPHLRTICFPDHFS